MRRSRGAITWVNKNMDPSTVRCFEYSGAKTFPICPTSLSGCFRRRTLQREGYFNLSVTHPYIPVQVRDCEHVLVTDAKRAHLWLSWNRGSSKESFMNPDAVCTFMFKLSGFAKTVLICSGSLSSCLGQGRNFLQRGEAIFVFDPCASVPAYQWLPQNVSIFPSKFTGYRTCRSGVGGTRRTRKQSTP